MRPYKVCLTVEYTVIYFANLLQCLSTQVL